MIRLTRVAAAVAVAAVSSCTAGPSATSAGVVRGTVDYAGPETGPLRVAVFASFPPSGAPVSEVVIDEPRFPQGYAVPGVPPGRYFVLAMVDVDPRDGYGHHPARDPGGAYGGYASPAPITVDVSDGAAFVDVALTDPASSDWNHDPYE